MSSGRHMLASFFVRFLGEILSAPRPPRAVYAGVRFVPSCGAVLLCTVLLYVTHFELIVKERSRDEILVEQFTGLTSAENITASVRIVEKRVILQLGT